MCWTTPRSKPKPFRRESFGHDIDQIVLGIAAIDPEPRPAAHRSGGIARKHFCLTDAKTRSIAPRQPDLRSQCHSFLKSNLQQAHSERRVLGCVEAEAIAARAARGTLLAPSRRRLAMQGPVGLEPDKAAKPGRKVQHMARDLDPQRINEMARRQPRPFAPLVSARGNRTIRSEQQHGAKPRRHADPPYNLGQIANPRHPLGASPRSPVASRR